MSIWTTVKSYTQKVWSGAKGIQETGLSGDTGTTTTDIAPTYLPPPTTTAPSPGGGGSGGGGITVPETVTVGGVSYPTIPAGQPMGFPSGTPLATGGGGTIASQILTKEEEKALGLREQLKVEAEKRGRGFTRLETERFLGGGMGISALRSGTRKVRRVSGITGLSFTEIITRQLQPKIEPSKIKDQVQMPSLIDEGVTPRISIKDFFFGEVGKPFVGFDIFPKVFPSLQKKDVTAQQIKTLFKQAPGKIGFPVRVAAELIPTTPGEVAITGGLIGAAILAPPIVGTFISGGVAGLGIKGAFFTTGLTLEQRTASGLVAGLGITGAVAGVVPFLRGVGAKPVKIAPEGFQVIKGVKDVGDIGLIQPGKGVRTFVDLPKTSPLVKGGFGRRPGGEQLFIGRKQLLGTSQRGLFEVGKDIPIEKEFFVTPQEPTLKIAETRISRLGLQDPFKFPESLEIGFGLPKVPQIGITRGAVARTERGGAFAIGKGTELEAIKTTGIITDIAQIGRTRIKGQGVEIFEFKLGVDRGKIKRVSPEDFISTEGTARISGETILSAFIRRPTRGISRPTSPIISPQISLGISPPISPPLSPPKTPPISSPISPPTSSIISPPTIPLISPPMFPPFLPPEEPLRRIKDGRRKPIKIKKKKRPGFRIQPAPSFTAQVMDLRGIFPKEFKLGKIDLGILPSQLRVIPNRRKKRK